MPDPSAACGAPPTDQDPILDQEREHVVNLRAEGRRNDGLTALCLSGGGIRSATFSLGVLQGLSSWYRNDAPASSDDPTAKETALEAVDYLSTVSGGGYIGSWLTRWLYGNGNKIAEVVDTLSNRPEATQIRYLRAFSNYLAPKMGMSTDRLTLISIIGRNLLLNWLVLLPALATILMLPRLVIALALLAEQSWGSAGAIICGGLAFLLTAIVVGIVAVNIPPTPNRPLQKTWPFTVLTPFAAFLWALAWAGVAHYAAAGPADQGPAVSSGSMLLYLAGIGVSCHVVGGTLVASILSRFIDPHTRRASDKSAADQPFSLGIAAAVVGSGIFAGVLLWIGTLLFGSPSTHLKVFVILAVPYLLACYWLTTTLYSALVASRMLRGAQGENGEGGEPAREWWGRAGGASLKPLVAWIFLTSLVILGPELLVRLGSWASTVIAVGGVGGLVSILTGLWGRAGSKERPPTKGVSAWLQEHALPIGAGAFLLLLGILGSLALSYSVAPPQQRHDVFDSTTEARLRSSAAKKIQDAQCKRAALTRGFIEGLACAPPTPTTAATPTATPTSATPESSPSASPAAVQLQSNDRVVSTLLAATNPLGPFNLSALGDLHRQVTGWEPTRPEGTSLRECAILGALLSVLLLGWLLVDVNRFSLHAMYGNRLIRAYLGASRPNRDPNRFSDIDPEDDVAMANLKSQRPFHVVNLALNLSSAATRQQFAEQSRRSASFTITPLNVGSPMTTFTSTAGYTGEAGPSLGRAMTISGAAVSPAMGYHSSPIVAAAMTLFNARLGWWLPHPNGSKRNRDSSPLGLWLLFLELFGFTSDQLEWVHVSDGGHFENLGLYEMIRRRCPRIVLVDATADPKFRYDDLARSLRMIRADFGVTIEFDGATRPQIGKAPKSHFALARIKYPSVATKKPEMPAGTRPDASTGTPSDDDAKSGVLIYIKPVLTDEDPLDLKHYYESRRQSGETFPHESTVDQFFNESQFESYRMLGIHSVIELKARHPSFDNILPDDIDPSSGSHGPGNGNPGSALEGAGAGAATSASAAGGGGGNGWSDAFATLATSLAPAAVSAAVATTVVVGVNGTIGLRAPDKPLELSSKTLQIEGRLPPVELDPRGLEKLKLTLRDPILRLKRAEIRRLEVSITRGVARGDAKMLAKLLNLYQQLLDLLAKIRNGAPPPSGNDAEILSVLKAIRGQVDTLNGEVRKLGPRIERIGPRRNVTGVQ